MIKTQINFPDVLIHMIKLRDNFNEVIEELEILSNKKIRAQIKKSLMAEKKGKTKTYSLSEFKREIIL